MKKSKQKGLWKVLCIGLAPLGVFLACGAEKKEEVLSVEASDSLVHRVNVAANGKRYSAKIASENQGLRIDFETDDRELPVSIWLGDTLDYLRIQTAQNRQVLKYYFDNFGLSAYEVNYVNDAGEDILSQGRITMNNRATKLSSGKVYSLFYELDTVQFEQETKIHVLTNLSGDSVLFDLICETPMGYTDTLIPSTLIEANYTTFSYSSDKYFGWLAVTGTLKRIMRKSESEVTWYYDRISFPVLVVKATAE